MPCVTDDSDTDSSLARSLSIGYCLEIEEIPLGKGEYNKDKDSFNPGAVRRDAKVPCHGSGEHQYDYEKDGNKSLDQRVQEHSEKPETEPGEFKCQFDVLRSHDGYFSGHGYHHS